jgi:integrase
MRHTYVTLGLMSAVKPAFLADQLGNSLPVFFRDYARWISSRDDQAEMAKLNAAVLQLSHDCPKASHTD